MFLQKRTAENRLDRVRKRKKTNRYGNRESSNNYDQFFQELANKKDQTSVSPDFVHILNESEEVLSERRLTEEMPRVTSSPNGNQNEDIQLCMLYELLQTSIKKIEFLQNHILKLDEHIIKLDVKIKNMTCSESSNKPKTVELTKLKSFGLPVDDFAALERLENNLKNDDEFTNKLVSFFLHSFCMRAIFVLQCLLFRSDNDIIILSCKSNTIVVYNSREFVHMK